MKEKTNEREFDEQIDDLRLLNILGEAVGDLPSEKETHQMWRAFAAKQEAKQRKNKIQMWSIGLAAAVTLLAVFILPWGDSGQQEIEVFAALNVPKEITTTESHNQIVLSTPAATTTHLTLDDGTQVMLSANSRLEYPKKFSMQGNREVRLTGQARFNVAKDAERPFIVQADRMQTQVLGTVFDVNAYPGGVAAVTLFQGSIRVSDTEDAQVKEVLPGQQATVLKGKGIVLTQAPLIDAESWTQGEFHFDEAELEEVMKSIGTWYNTGIVFHSVELLKRRIHFRFPRTAQLEEVLQALNELGIAKLTEEEGKVRIRLLL